MKYWIRLMLLVGAVLAVFAVIGSLLPRSYDFSTQIEVNSPAKEIFPQINTISNWKNWTQWNPADIPGLTVQYSGEEAGEGATQTWKDVRGHGKLWITKSVPGKEIAYNMDFANFPTMTGRIEISELGESQSVVRWSSRGKLPGGPFYGFFAPFFSTQMKNQYDQSLAKLKNLVESNGALPANDAATDQAD